MVTFWKRKKKEAEETDEVIDDEFSYNVDEPAEAREDLVDVGEKDELDDEDEEDGESPWAIESLDVGGYWDRRFATLQLRVDTELWKARALGGNPELRAKGLRDYTYIELTSKAESMYIELRCALSVTKDAPDVIMQAHNQLNALRMRVGTKLYPTAVLGMVQACLHEQQMGFHTVLGSIWDFDVDMVNAEYARALQGLEVIAQVIEAVEEAEEKELSEGDDAAD